MHILILIVFRFTDAQSVGFAQQSLKSLLYFLYGPIPNRLTLLCVAQGPGPDCTVLNIWHKQGKNTLSPNHRY